MRIPEMGPGQGHSRPHAHHHLLGRGPRPSRAAASAVCEPRGGIAVDSTCWFKIRLMASSLRALLKRG